jgi:L-lactate utilization protein LutC
MEDDTYWRSRASDMRERAAHTKDPFVSGGFIALAEQYELLAQDGARWVRAATSLYQDEHIEVLPDDPPAPRAKPRF